MTATVNAALQHYTKKESEYSPQIIPLLISSEGFHLCQEHGKTEFSTG